MNRLCCSLVVTALTAFVLFSCDDDDEPFKKAVQWEKIEFENEGAVYAIHGNVDDYLLVSTISKILRSDNRGRTWNVVGNSLDPIGDFFALNDDIYAVSNGVDYVSHDQGQTWQSITFDHELQRASGTFTDSKGILYEIVYHHDGELALPTTLLRSIDKGNSWEAIFPHQHVFYSSHIGADDRVYIGTWGAMWDGRSFGGNPENTAYLYWMK
jgi:hypothetical protein